MEDEGIEYLVSILKDNFIIKLTDEGCLADLGIKPNNSNTDFILVQIKTTGSKKLDNSYRFDVNSKYPNHLVICLSLDDKRQWLMNGSDIKTMRKLQLVVINQSILNMKLKMLMN
jgi:hypothetical protein